MDWTIRTEKFVMPRRSSILVGLLAVGFGCAAPATAPEHLSFESFETSGKTVTLRELRGKVVVLDFWATWCGPCRENFPFIREVHEKYKNKEFQLVAITDERRGTIEEFEKHWKSNYPIFLDTDRSVNDAFGVTGIPRLIVIGKSGEILFDGHPAQRDEVLRAIDSGLKS